MKTDYSEYSVGVTTEPMYYGSECSADRAENIADDLTRMIENEFPGIKVTRDESKVCGPDEEVCYEINLWIQKNWTAAL